MEDNIKIFLADAVFEETGHRGKYLILRGDDYIKRNFITFALIQMLLG